MGRSPHHGARSPVEAKINRQLNRLKELEEENKRLRKRIANLVIDQCGIRQSNNALRKENKKLKRELRQLGESLEFQSRLP